LKYQPQQIDTSGIRLSDEITSIAEVLAKNVHEVWAQKRISEGWKYGTARNDDRKEHPCLVPYENLPEDERVYDLVTVTETLKTIVALGYYIEKR
jgi:hypothetical protein